MDCKTPRQGRRWTRKREFLDEMNLVVPCAELVLLIAPHAPEPSAKDGRPPFAVETMLRIHFLQQRFNLSDPAMEEALYDMALFREFVGLDAGEDNLPDESSILRFRHLLETHNLSLQILATVNATLIAAPSSTKNSSGERAPEMHQTKKGNQWHFGMKAHIGVDADSGLVHTVVGTAANVNWHVAMRPGKRKVLDKSTPKGAIPEQLEQVKARIRAKVEHPFTLFALSNLWMVRRTLLQEMRG